MTAATPQHLSVMQDAFAGERFWAALDRLAEREGHQDHGHYLVGQLKPDNRYQLWYVPCAAVVVTMQVRRRDPPFEDMSRG